MPPKSKTTSASGAAGGAGAANNQPQASRYNLRRRPVSHYIAKEVAKGSSAASDIIEAANILLAISKGPRVAQPSQSSSSGRKRPAIEISSDDDDSEPDLEAPKAKVAKREPRKTQARKIQPAQQRNLAPATSKRSERILNPNNAEDANLIAGATKVGAEYYDSDADDLSGAIPGMGGTKANLFRHVKWGSYAEDESNDADFPTQPVFRQFVPGRFERLEDGTIADQKAKLVVKLTDTKGNKHIYKNPPPKDWSNQEAITALNKRTVQQIRRTTAVNFRAPVLEYTAVERRWVLQNLTAGKPTHGWKRLVADFNQRFAGKLVQGSRDPRPARTQSSLSKEVGRHGDQFYSKGRVPPTK
jgi:hypothetical protein